MEGFYKIATEPTAEPLTLDEIKTHLKVDGTDEDTYLEMLGKAARQFMESWLDRSIPETGWEMVLDYFPSVIEIRKSVSAITGITYFDENGDAQTMPVEDYQTDLVSPIARVVAVDQWPSSDGRISGIKVAFTAGFTEVPANLKMAMLLMIGRMYEQREDSVQKMPLASEYLAMPYKIYS